MTQAESSVIIQARTGKIGPRSYLHSIGAENSQNCPCREEAQLLQHILLCCPEFEELRETMWELRRETDLKTLLGFGGISETGSTISHLYKITPTIFQGKPILNRGRCPRR